MSETYGEAFSDMVDREAKYRDRPDIFRALDISKNQFYNVTNPNRTTSGGNPYPFPMEWMVRATKEFGDYELIRMVAHDCGGLFISPDDVEEMDGPEAERVLEAFKKIVGKIKTKKKPRRR